MSAFKLPAALTTRITELQGDLAAYLDDARAEFEERSERWRDGDTGTAVDTWIETLSCLADDLDNVDAAPEV